MSLDNFPNRPQVLRFDYTRFSVFCLITKIRDRRESRTVAVPMPCQRRLDAVADAQPGEDPADMGIDRVD